jgi:hypothetical protein
VDFFFGIHSLQIGCGELRVQLDRVHVDRGRLQLRVSEGSLDELQVAVLRVEDRPACMSERVHRVVLVQPGPPAIELEESLCLLRRDREDAAPRLALGSRQRREVVSKSPASRLGEHDLLVDRLARLRVALLRPANANTPGTLAVRDPAEVCDAKAHQLDLANPRESRRREERVVPRDVRVVVPRPTAGSV